MIAVGGGVTGDVAGFVAATYHRGIPWVQVPTTLLAMIDSSIGGKTGVDTAQGKNLLGAFHQPRLVLADLDTLATLPVPQLAAGMAEAIKHAAIADADYFATLERADVPLTRDSAALERAVTRSVEIKAEIVSADEREAGRRAVLNFGHTVGHALEATSGYTLLHGEAVAIGMVVEARLAEALRVAEAGTARRIAACIAAPSTADGDPRGVRGRSADRRDATRQESARRRVAIRIAVASRRDARCRRAASGLSRYLTHWCGRWWRTERWTGDNGLSSNHLQPLLQTFNRIPTSFALESLSTGHVDSGQIAQRAEE